MLNEDYSDMLCALRDAEAEFMLVGAYAMAAHGYPRATGDIDILVRPSAENSRRVYAALCAFGVPASDIDERTFTEPNVVFQIGVIPRRIDIITGIDGVSVDDAFERKVSVSLDESTGAIDILCIDDLIHNKQSTGRPKDDADAQTLMRNRNKRDPS